MTKLAMLVVIVLALSTAAAAQAPPANRAPTAGTLRQIIPGHYVYTQNNAGRLFNSGVVAAGDGVLVFDALDSEALARSEREAIAGVIKQPIRYLVSSVFHDPFSKGNLAYGDVFKIGHENYRAGLLDQMQRGQLSDEEQRTRRRSRGPGSPCRQDRTSCDRETWRSAAVCAARRLTIDRAASGRAGQHGSSRARS